jgi:hypothetical protein
VLTGLRLAAVLAVVLMLGQLPAAQAAPRAKREPYPALQRQISSGEVRQATVSPKTRSVKVRLRSGVKYVAKYPAGADPTASLRAHGAHVRVAAHKAKAKASGHVRFRYIALAVAAALALAGAAAYFLRRRRSAGPRVDAGPPVA